MLIWCIVEVRPLAVSSSCGCLVALGRRSIAVDLPYGRDEVGGERPAGSVVCLALAVECRCCSSGRSLPVRFCCSFRFSSPLSLAIGY